MRKRGRSAWTMRRAQRQTKRTYLEHGHLLDLHGSCLCLVCAAALVRWRGPSADEGK